MNAKQYLNQYRRIKAEVDAIDRNIAKIRAELKNIGDISIKSAWPDGQPHGTVTTDPTGAKAAQIADQYAERYLELAERLQEYEFELVIRRSKLWSKQMEITDTLSKIDDFVLYQILQYKYIEGRSFEWIAVQIHYTWRHTIRLHGQALQKVEAILNE